MSGCVHGNSFQSGREQWAGGPAGKRRLQKKARCISGCVHGNSFQSGRAQRAGGAAWERRLQRKALAALQAMRRACGEREHFGRASAFNDYLRRLAAAAIESGPHRRFLCAPLPASNAEGN